MADRQPEDREMSASKRVKLDRNVDPIANTYLTSTLSSPPSIIIMTDRGPEDQEMSTAKRVKMERNLDPTVNPYLAHHYNGNGNGYAPAQKNSALEHFRRHNTTAEQAHLAEDGPNNPFNGTPLSSTYFSILKTRRDLPVHQQRSVLIFVDGLNNANITV
jgi:pre-mRNA-splicing factor ATP-dependent RNA helicase DHX15/PRP43